ncbi:hypothetical protein AB394_14515, partial [Listeria monocytogenes]|nr:hypothetical protein [Listeria monocytogenes]
MEELFIIDNGDIQGESRTLIYDYDCLLFEHEQTSSKVLVQFSVDLIAFKKENSIIYYESVYEEIKMKAISLMQKNLHKKMVVQLNLVNTIHVNGLVLISDFVGKNLNEDFNEIEETQHF